MAERKPLSKRIRFEVFKRDSFACQYCGRKAPDVLLHVDHIVPVAGDGENDILNLITSCMACNLGKSDKSLADNAIITLKQDQLAQLQERQNQLQMMMEWQRSLHAFDEEALGNIVDFWIELAPGWQPSDNGTRILRELVTKYGADAVMSAMRNAQRKIVLEEVDGRKRATQESWETAFDLIGRICRVEERAKSDPHARETAYICGILKKRFHYWNPSLAGRTIQAAFSWGASFEEIKECAVSARSWSQFRDLVGELIDQLRAEEQTSQSPAVSADSI